MKNTYKFFAGVCGALLLLSSCSSILEEHPKTRYTPDFFTTQAGIEGGLTALYTHIREIYGNAYAYNALTTGTDEATWAQSADGNFKTSDMSGNGVLSPSNQAGTGAFWSFTYVNTANGIIENAEAVGLAPALVAEAKFFRAFEYFSMVRNYGGVPLDLGSGELAFNSSPVRTSVRNTVPEVYTKCIFPDLKEGVANLPATPRVTGAISKTAARMVLSKAYLTYAWWLENPNNIPTYPECPRTDPDGHDAKWYFQAAYDLAIEAIQDPGPYGLMDYFWQTNAGQYDRNKECVFYADHTQNSEQYNGASLSYGSGGGQDNFAGWMMTWNYPNMTATANTGARINPVLRTDNQFLGRPWTRMAPTQEALAKFIDPDKDSRADGTFTLTFKTNWNQGGNGAEWVEGPNGKHIGLGETFLAYIFEDDPTVDYSYNSSNGLFGVSPNYDYYLITPSRVSRNNYPGMWKMGPYRTDGADSGNGVGNPNAASTRPFVILKFSELYLTAAEAAVKGASTKAGFSARECINVLRARAGKWNYKVNEGAEYIADFSKELTDKTPETITIDYILDESLRENFAAGFRWYELTRTQTWEQRAGTYTICGAGVSDITPEKFTRTITPKDYLHPIPKGQIDALMMDDSEKAAYQNPGYPVE
ncbi:MAG: RagB/SusD family nutrient uptake outer membrane protein [Bacteroidia bacterium]|nr:RagB/SusD family nutrient uptake outer membrane protein [Bacteroidia bacterium]